jgi:hypothetical protein
MFVLVQFLIDLVWDVGKGGGEVWGQRCWQNIMGHGGDGTWSSRLKVEPLKARFFFYLLLSSSYLLLLSSFFFFPHSSFFCLHLSASFVFPSLFVFPFSSSFVLFIHFCFSFYYTYLALTLSNRNTKHNPHHNPYTLTLSTPDFLNPQVQVTRDTVLHNGDFKNLVLREGEQGRESRKSKSTG